METRKILRTSVFDRNLDALGTGNRYICNEGGARSGKTFSIMQLFISLADNLPGRSFTVCSRSLPHLKQGALRDFLMIMKDWGIYREEEHNRTDQVYTFPNGSYIEFIGLEDPGKARGPGRDVLFVNEANLISKALFDQLNIRTRKKVFIDLNPADFDCWCYQLADGPNAVKIHSTYKDNPYLPQAQVEAIEAYKLAGEDELMWQVFGLGLRGTSKETIYTHWKLVPELPGKGRVFYGLDFGYTVQTAMVQVEEYEGTCYVKEVIYQTNLTTQDLIGKIKALGIGKAEIFCDAAEPKTIEELHRAGLNAKPADKDVWAGIMKVKSMPLLVHAESHNLRKELSGYKWKVDKNDKVLEEPEKTNDHLCDAMRYAIFTKLTQKTRTWVGA